MSPAATASWRGLRPGRRDSAGESLERESVEEEKQRHEKRRDQADGERHHQPRGRGSSAQDAERAVGVQDSHHDRANQIEEAPSVPRQEQSAGDSAFAQRRQQKKRSKSRDDVAKPFRYRKSGGQGTLQPGDDEPQPDKSPEMGPDEERKAEACGKSTDRRADPVRRHKSEQRQADETTQRNRRAAGRIDDPQDPANTSGHEPRSDGGNGHSSPTGNLLIRHPS